jgi:hypothetical protein
MDFKIFIQARKEVSGTDGSGVPERMFAYEVAAESSELAVQRARQRFELEHGLEGWSIEGIGSVELP